MRKYVPLLLLTVLTSFSFEQVTTHLGSELVYTRIFQDCVAAQKGFLVGPSFDFQWTRPCRIYTGLFFDGLWKIGHICSRDGVFADNHQYDVRLKIGYPFLFESCSNFTFIPHVGVGYIHFSHEIEPDIIRFKYNHVYVPVGFSIEHYFCDYFSWQFIAYYRIDAWTRLKTTTPCLCNTKECTIDLKRTHGFHLEVPLSCDYCINECITLQLTYSPLFDWLKFPCPDPCNCNATVPIPELRTWKLGSKALLGISF